MWDTIAKNERLSNLMRIQISWPQLFANLISIRIIILIVSDPPIRLAQVISANQKPISFLVVREKFSSMSQVNRAIEREYHFGTTINIPNKLHDSSFENRVQFVTASHFKNIKL